LRRAPSSPTARTAHEEQEPPSPALQDSANRRNSMAPSATSSAGMLTGLQSPGSCAWPGRAASAPRRKDAAATLSQTRPSEGIERGEVGVPTATVCCEPSRDRDIAARSIALLIVSFMRLPILRRGSNQSSVRFAGVHALHPECCDAARPPMYMCLRMKGSVSRR
jgi:hypothetical protein